MVDIEMYYRDFCGFCARADRLLQSKNVEYRRINIWEVDGAKEEMIERSGGRRTVPQIFIDGQPVGGSDELFALDAGFGVEGHAADSLPTGDTPLPLLDLFGLHDHGNRYGQLVAHKSLDSLQFLQVFPSV